jgi:hypothetical protein
MRPARGEYPVTLAGVGRPVADPLCRVLARVAGRTPRLRAGPGNPTRPAERALWVAPKREIYPKLYPLGF